MPLPATPKGFEHQTRARIKVGMFCFPTETLGWVGQNNGNFHKNLKKRELRIRKKSENRILKTYPNVFFLNKKMTSCKCLAPEAEMGPYDPLYWP